MYAFDSAPLPFFPDGIQTKFCKAPFSCIRSYCIPIHQHAFSCNESREITVLDLGVSNPRGVVASLSFKFEERVNIVRKFTAFAGVRIVFRHFLFVHFYNIEDMVALLNG